MQAGDMVYYLHVNAVGTEVKFPALVLDVGDNGIYIRVGRFNPTTSKLATFESTVENDKLTTRTTAFSFEDELKGIV